MRSPLAAIPPEEVFESLVAHEMTHVFVAGMAPAGQINRSGQEYMAYAMQLQALPDASRQAITGAFNIRRPVETDALGDTIMDVAPMVFAARVWAHFSDQGNGCAFFADLIARRVVLPAMRP